MHDDVFFLAPIRNLKTTTLYGLRPLGENTGDVESLFSYFLRLTHEHRLTPKKMVDVVLREVMAQIPGVARYKLGWGWDKNAGKEIVDAGVVADRWITILGKATGQTGLQHATLLPIWGRVFGDLTTAEDRVCLQCEREDTAKGDLPYGRLLWRLRSVTCCPKHGCQLVVPICGREPGGTKEQLRRVKLSGVCSACGCIGHGCSINQADLATPGEVWRAEQCRRMIASMDAIAQVNRREVARRIKEHCAAPGALTRLALRSGAPKSVLSQWLNSNDAAISFDQLLDICGAEGLDLASLLQGRLERSAEWPGPLAPARLKRCYARVDHDAVRQALKDAVESAKSATDVARQLCVDIGTLAQHRDLYDVVREATRVRKAAAEDARQDKAIEAAERLAIILLRKGQQLTWRSVHKQSDVRLYPGEIEAAVLALIRIGLGDRTVRYPMAARRMGETFLRKIDLAVHRVKAATGADQLTLGLDYHLANHSDSGSG